VTPDQGEITGREAIAAYLRELAEAHSIGFVVQVDSTLGRVAVELEQHVGVIDDLGDRFRAVRAVVDLECLDRHLRLVDVRPTG
jgi:hypothetical protein